MLLSSLDEYLITTGFPNSCRENDLILLEPDIMSADEFFLLPSGQLVVPHRFWIFSPDDYCTDDFMAGDDMTNVCTTFRRYKTVICLFFSAL